MVEALPEDDIEPATSSKPQARNKPAPKRERKNSSDEETLPDELNPFVSSLSYKQSVEE